MKKIKSSAVAAVLFGCTMFANTAQAQTILTPHFTDESKKIVTPKDASVCPEIHDGMIAIWVGYGKAVFVNTKGEYVFGTDFPVSAISSLNYAESHFSGGAAMVKRPEGNYCILYPDGTYRDLPKDYSIATGFCEGYAIVNKKITTYADKMFYVDTQGREVFPALSSLDLSTLVSPLRDNRRLICVARKYGYADEKGNVVIKPQFDLALPFSDGLAAVRVEENNQKKWGFIDGTGKMVIPATYKLEPGRFSEGKAAVRIGEKDYDYEMAYIDKTGKRLIENKKWNLNEFHNGFAWVATDLWKVSVIDNTFTEVKDISEVIFPNDNGFGVLQMKNHDKYFGIDFPGGTQAVMSGNIGKGNIVSSDGTMLYQAGQVYYEPATLYNPTEGGLIFCEVRMKDAPQLKEKEGYLPCFINTQGEIVYYFEAGYEGFEGPTPTAAKAISAPATPQKAAATGATAKKPVVKK